MSSELAKVYDPRATEERWAKTWLDGDLLVADPARPGEAFSIVIPPPNITGQLHLGHALNNTLQDVLMRWKRMDGANVLWVPGTDHASIATQNVVERQLAQQGLDRHGIGRDAFLERTFAWKNEVGPYIVSQLKRLGATCDWSRERFTMDEGLSRAVREVFVRLWEEGLVYRGRRLINWCCRCGTALSDIEVEHKDVAGSLWHLRYPLADGSGFVTVATTRPETMLGDTAVAVNPDDPRYAGLIGKKLVLPVLGREIPVLADAMVDKEFGTGAVKITPAHDFADFDTGKRHGLASIPVIDEAGRMTEAAGPYAGLDRAECRTRIVADFEQSGVLEKVDSYALSVGQCYRCQQVVEPLLSTQWFVQIEPLARPAIAAVREGRTRFYPEHWSKTYFAWMENIRDWCISRQLWWGHRIPAWYCRACVIAEPADDGTGGERKGPRVIVAREAPAACPECGGPVEQDEDVLDTWFSSGLWPFSTMGWPDQTPELARYYPTSVLVTGFDILFFWVARMMMFGLRFTGEVPFRDVYVHGLVRDEHGQKMSKSKGNVKDPLELLGNYGTDALRFTLVAQSAMGRDIRLSLERIDGSRAFANKIWNAARFVLMNLEGFDAAAPPPSDAELDLPSRWIRTRLARAIEETRAALEAYRFNDVATTIYRFLWNEYCDWYLELVKHTLTDGEPRAKAAVRSVLVSVLETALRLLHPVMPFVTEELWHALPHPGAVPQSLLDARFPRAEDLPRDLAAEAAIERLIETVRALRNLRSEMGVAPGRGIDLWIAAPDAASRDLVAGLLPEIRRLARVENVSWIEGESRPRGAAVATAAGLELHVPLAGLVDVAAERTRLAREVEKVAKELDGVERKLGNADYIARAPDDVVTQTRERAAELAERHQVLERSLARLAEVDAGGDGQA